MIAILQPFVPHYREDFFSGLQNQFNVQLYCYERDSAIARHKFNKSSISVNKISSFFNNLSKSNFASP